MYLECVRPAGVLYHCVEKCLRRALLPTAAGHAARGFAIVCGGIRPDGKYTSLQKWHPADTSPTHPSAQMTVPAQERQSQ